MGTSYTRNDTSNNIADGNIINATDLDGEFDAIQSAFATTGHTHDGTAAEGGPITVAGPAQDLVVSATNVNPKTTNTLDLGTASLLYKDAYLQGVMNFRDVNLKISSSTDGQLDIDADGELEIVAPIVDINASTGLALDGANLNSAWTVNTNNKIQFRDTGLYINSSADGQLDIVADTEIQIAATTIDINGAINASGEIIAASLDISGNIDVDGTTNLDVVDIDGAVDMATTLAVAGNVDFNGALDVDGTTNLDVVDIDGAVDMATTLAVAGNVDFNGDLDVDGTTNLDVVDIDGAVNMATTLLVTGNVDFNGDLDVDGTTNLDVVDIDGAVDMASTLQVDGAITNSSTIVSTGKITADAGIDIDNFNIDGTTMSLSSGNMTLDVAGNVTIDADGGTVTFADAGSSLGTITSSGYSGTAAVATAVTITDNESTNENNAIIFTAGGDLDGGNLGLESDGDMHYNPSTGTLTVPNVSVSGTFSTVNSVTMDANNAVIFEGSTADAHETTLTSVDATADRTITLPNVSGTVPVLAAASNTQVTSTPEELNKLDGATVVVGEINALDLGSTAIGTAIASKAVVLDSNKDYTGVRNFTVSGELDAATGDFSGDVDVDGTLEADAITIGGTAIASVLSPVAGSGSIVTTGALNAGSITSDFGIINNGASAITTTGVGSFASLDISGAIDVDGTANLDVVDIDGAVNMATTALVTGVLTTTAATVHNGGFASNANSTIGGTLITTGNMSISETGANNEKSITIANSSVAGGIIGVEGASANRFNGSAANNMFIGTITADGLEFATNNVVRANIASGGAASFNSTLSVAGTVTANNTITTIAPDADHTSLEQVASSTTGAVRQLFKNSDNSKNFELSGFFSSGTEQLTVQSKTNTITRFFHDGSVLFEGNINAVAGGINLGATGSANLLDDYEIGSWTPTLVGADTAGTYTVVTGTSAAYTKVGRMVSVQARITLSAASGGGGTAIFGGLPFNYASGSLPLGQCATSAVDLTNTNPPTISFQPTSSGAAATLVLAETRDNAGGQSTPITAFSTSSTIYLNMTYRV